MNLMKTPKNSLQSTPTRAYLDITNFLLVPNQHQPYSIKRWMPCWCVWWHYFCRCNPGRSFETIFPDVDKVRRIHCWQRWTREYFCYQKHAGTSKYFKTMFFSTLSKSLEYLFCQNSTVSEITWNIYRKKCSMELVNWLLICFYQNQSSTFFGGWGDLFLARYNLSSDILVSDTILTIALELWFPTAIWRHLLVHQGGHWQSLNEIRFKLKRKP